MTLLFSEHGSRVGCLDTDKEAVQTVLKQAKEDKVVNEKLVHGFSSLDKLVEAFPSGTSPPYSSLMSDGKKPRMLVLSLPHGKPADGILEEILPKLNKGDIIIDAGNEWWADTERRQAKAGEKGIKWVGMGVSGGCKLPFISLWIMLNEQTKPLDMGLVCRSGPIPRLGRSSSLTSKTGVPRHPMASHVSTEWDQEVLDTVGHVPSSWE
jgi:hypothetical protein